MKKVGIIIGVIIVMLFVIPIVILGGVGEGIKLPSKIIPGITDKNDSNKGNNAGPLKIKVYRSDINKVEEMDFETYITGVVAAEMPAEANVEALKAQAVASRTYALAKMKGYGGNTCPKHPEAGEHDVCSDTHCQVWKSKEERYKTWGAEAADGYWSKIETAVKETEGKVLSYKGELAEAIKYHASSVGKTENSMEVFGYESPYLVSVSSEYEKDNPKCFSTVEMTADEFVKKIKAIDSTVKISSNNLASQIKAPELNESGRVKSIQIGDKKFTGVELRNGLGATTLKSTNFTIKVEGKKVIFDVRGSGHGVGMSQWGAMEMAKRGSKYDEILKHYYTGVEINDISDIFKNKIQ